MSIWIEKYNEKKKQQQQQKNKKQNKTLHWPKSTSHSTGYSFMEHQPLVSMY